MSLIRLNRKSILKLVVLLIILISLKFILKNFKQENRASLDFDYLNRQFIVNIPNDYFEALPDKRDFGNDLYVLAAETNYLKYWINFQIKSIKFEYSKIFLYDWVPVLQEAVNLGINTVEIELVWHLHEKIKGTFDFKSNNFDLEELVKLVKTYKLFLVVRIDPYLPCSDYQMGGLPNWLLVDPISDGSSQFLSLKNEKFIRPFENYLDAVLKILAKYQLSNNGPIIGILIQYYDNPGSDSYEQFYDENYTKFIFERLKKNGIVEKILKSVSVCDYNRLFNDQNSNEFCDANLHLYFPLEYNLKIKKLSYHDCSEKESGSKDFEYFVANQNIKFGSNLKELLTTKKSFGIKNFFCYTNFGFESSSVKFFNKQICLLDQIGTRTKKYDTACQILQNKPAQKIEKYNYSNFIDLSSHEIFHADKRIYNISITHILPFKSLLDKISSPPKLISKKDELFVEYLIKTYKLSSNGKGYVFYRLEANLKSGSQILVKPNLIKDYAIIKCDFKKNIITLEPGKYDKILIFNLKQDCNEIQILVEIFETSCNFNPKREELIQNRKGILTKDAVIFKRKNSEAYEIGANRWKVNLLDFLPNFFNRVTFGSAYITYEQFSKTDLKKLDNPLILYAKIYIQKSVKKEFIYLIVKNLKRGTVFLNGFNLARYSDKNKVSALFIPKNLLNNGTNEILIFDLHGIQYERFPEIFITKEYVFI